MFDQISKSFPIPSGTTHLAVDSENDIYAYDEEPIIVGGYVHPRPMCSSIYVGRLLEVASTDSKPCIYTV